MNMNYKKTSLILATAVLLAGCNFQKVAEKPSLPDATSPTTPTEVVAMEKDDHQMDVNEASAIEVKETPSNPVVPSVPVAPANQVEASDLELVEAPEVGDGGGGSVAVDQETLRVFEFTDVQNCNAYEGVVRQSCHRAKGTSETPRVTQEDTPDNEVES